MYIVKPDGSILCETAKDALELQAQMLLKAASGPTLAPTPADHDHRASIHGRGFIQNASTNEDVAFLQKLRNYTGQTVGAKEILPLVGASNYAGVGSKVSWTCKRLEKDGIRIREYIRAVKDEDNRPAWKILKAWEYD